MWTIYNSQLLLNLNDYNIKDQKNDCSVEQVKYYFFRFLRNWNLEFCGISGRKFQFQTIWQPKLMKLVIELNSEYLLNCNEHHLAQNSLQQPLNLSAVLNWFKLWVEGDLLKILHVEHQIGVDPKVCLEREALGGLADNRRHSLQ